MKTPAYLIAVSSLATAFTLNAAEPALVSQPAQADQTGTTAAPAKPAVAIPGKITSSPVHPETTGSCLSLPALVDARISEDPAKVTEIVADMVVRNPACSCEVVKAAIETSKPDAKTVAAIVEAAIHAAPEHMRLIAQCAIAMAPDSLAEVQAVLARLEPNRGESADSSKSAKSAKTPVSQGEVAQMPNPLDFPGQGPVGPIPGGPGGFPLIPVLLPIILSPPSVTEVNP